MDFPNHFVPEFQYRPYYQPLQQDEDLWACGQMFRGQAINRVSETSSPSHSTMDRYLHERDRTLFTTSRTNGPLPPCPDLQNEATTYHDPYERLGQPYRYPSPTDSGPSSAYTSSAHSDDHSTPWSSPNPSACPHSPEMGYLDQLAYRHTFQLDRDEFKGSMGGHCVTLHDVQVYPDMQPETIRFEDEANFYPLPQEGFEPMEQDPEPEQPVQNGMNGVVNGHESSHKDASSPESPNIRRRRSQATRPATSPTKVTKRPSHTRRTSSFSKSNGHKNNAYCQSTSNRAFPCPFAIYSCTATFGAKNEWKRHVNTQHMQTGYWRCDQCDQSERKPNDFNRKDLFIQHVRRMHPLEGEKPTRSKSNNARATKNDPEERELNAIATRCFMPIREPPRECACIVCDLKFKGPTAWDERLEHIGKHWEATKKENEEPNDPKEWREDHALHDFLDEQGIIAAEGKRWVLV